MKVVVPYTNLHDLTKQSVPAHTEFAPVLADHDYFDLLDTLWSLGKSFIIIEHDIEIHDDVINSLTYCSQPWCAFPYWQCGMYTTAFGCVRFSERMIKACPFVFEELLSAPNPHYNVFQRRSNPFDFTGRQIDPDGQRYWATLDSRVGNILIREGFKPHRHEPAVMHWSTKHNPDLKLPPDWKSRSYQSAGGRTPTR